MSFWVRIGQRFITWLEGIGVSRAAPSGPRAIAALPAHQTSNALGLGAPSSAIALATTMALVGATGTGANVGPDTYTFLEPSVRAYMLWSPQLLRAAELAADNGDLMLAADLCDAMIADDRIKAVLDSRTDALLGRDLSFEEGLGRRKRVALRALDAEEDWYAAFPEVEIKALHAWMIMLGVALAELRWEESDEHGGRAIPHLEVKNPRWLRFDQQTREWKLTVANDDGISQHEITITPGDGKWVMLTAGGKSRPWANGAFRALSRWMLLKRYAIQDWGYVSEKLGVAMFAITGDGGTKEQRAELANEIKRLGRVNGMMLPKGLDIKLVEAAASTGEIFNRQIAVADNASAVCILGQNLSTQISAGDGSKAAATEHGKTALGRTKGDAESISTCIHYQALRWWALYNFQEPKLAPWPAWDTTPDEDLKERAAALQMLGQFLASSFQSGALNDIDVRGLLDGFNIPLRAPGAPPSQPPATPSAPDDPPRVASLLTRIERAHRELGEALAAAQTKEAA